MSLEDHIQALRTKHQTLDTELQTETRRPYPDTTTITRLKREKLRVKDEITRLVSA